MKTRWLFLLVAAFMLAAFSSPQAGELKSKPKKKDPPKAKPQWAPIDHSSFRIEPQVGLFMSCAYRLFMPGKSSTFSYAHEDKVKVEVTKDDKKKLRFTIYVDKKLRKFTREMIAAAMEGAVEQCYTLIGEEL